MKSWLKIGESEVSFGEAECFAVSCMGLRRATKENHLLIYVLSHRQSYNAIRQIETRGQIGSLLADDGNADDKRP